MAIIDAKAKAQLLVKDAKDAAHNGELQKSLKLFKEAYEIFPSEKLKKRINKLEDFIANLSEDEDDDEENDGMVDIGKKFFLHESIADQLYPYQKQGVLWFWELFKKKQGGILGDDMGLGKTIQVIAFLAGLFDAELIRHVIIVAPLSILVNWEKEFGKWAPGIRVKPYHGQAKKTRAKNLYKVQKTEGIIITTYGMVVSNTELLCTNENGDPFRWDYVILDEGHKIKNPTKTSKCVRQIPAKYHYVLSGTPIQNNLNEMWSLFDFTQQGQLLGTKKTFDTEFQKPIVRAREKDASEYEQQVGNKIAQSLRNIMAPFFLRRTKAEVFNNNNKNNVTDVVIGNEVDGKDNKKPPKIPELTTRKDDLIIWVYLSELQLKLYQGFVASERVKECLMTTRSPLAELNLLKKISDHPRLQTTLSKLLSNSDEHESRVACGIEVDESNSTAEMETPYDETTHAPPVEKLIEDSGKMVFLVHLMNNLKQEQHRTVIFSQSRKMLDIIQKVLKSMAHKLLRIDGTISNPIDRDKIVQLFQNDSSYTVMLMTTQVGSVGLTLTGADRLVIFDPSWNPGTDAQAVDRVYRVGQTKDVIIYRLITCGSIEEKIYRKQIFKNAVMKQATGASNNPYRYFTNQQLRELFVLDDPRDSKTQMQLENMHRHHGNTDEKFERHLDFLKSRDYIFGLTHHDQLFSQEASNTMNTDYLDLIEKQVSQAEQRVTEESNTIDFSPSKKDSRFFETSSPVRPKRPCDIRNKKTISPTERLEMSIAALQISDDRKKRDNVNQSSQDNKQSTNSDDNQSYMSAQDNNPSTLATTDGNQSYISAQDNNRSTLATTDGNQSYISAQNNNRSTLATTDGNQSYMSAQDNNPSTLATTDGNQSYISAQDNNRSTLATTDGNQSYMSAQDNNRSTLATIDVNQSYLTADGGKSQDTADCSEQCQVDINQSDVTLNEKSQSDLIVKHNVETSDQQQNISDSFTVKSAHGQSTTNSYVQGTECNNESYEAIDIGCSPHQFPNPSTETNTNDLPGDIPFNSNAVKNVASLSSQSISDATNASQPDDDVMRNCTNDDVILLQDGSRDLVSVEEYQAVDVACSPLTFSDNSSHGDVDVCSDTRQDSNKNESSLDHTCHTNSMREPIQLMGTPLFIRELGKCYRTPPVSPFDSNKTMDCTTEQRSTSTPISTGRQANIPEDALNNSAVEESPRGNIPITTFEQMPSNENERKSFTLSRTMESEDDINDGCETFFHSAEEGSDSMRISFSVVNRTDDSIYEVKDANCSAVVDEEFSKDDQIDDEEQIDSHTQPVVDSKSANGFFDVTVDMESNTSNEIRQNSNVFSSAEETEICDVSFDPAVVSIHVGESPTAGLARKSRVSTFFDETIDLSSNDEVERNADTQPIIDEDTSNVMKPDDKCRSPAKKEKMGSIEMLQPVTQDSIKSDDSMFDLDRVKKDEDEKCEIVGESIDDSSQHSAACSNTNISDSYLSDQAKPKESHDQTESRDQMESIDQTTSHDETESSDQTESFSMSKEHGIDTTEEIEARRMELLRLNDLMLENMNNKDMDEKLFIYIVDKIEELKLFPCV